jgi:large-conductance mechanosensitive channel
MISFFNKDLKTDLLILYILISFSSIFSTIKKIKKLKEKIESEVSKKKRNQNKYETLITYPL